MSAATSSSPRPKAYQRFLCGLFLVAVVLMTTQYAFLKHGQGKVFISPINLSQPDDFAHMPKDQRAGTYFINWAS